MLFLKSLYLHNFRLYEEKYVEFCPGINWIAGRNACGKTTILEAIHLLASGRSFRTHQLIHLIRHQASHFYLEVDFIKHGISQKLRMVHSPKERKITINNTPGLSVSNLLGLLLSVVFSPDDSELISGAPQVRRQFLDSQLAQVDPLYLHHLSRYQRAMKQRNTLLKARNLSAIEGWEHEMASSAAYLLSQRLPLIEALQREVTPIYRSISMEPSQLTLHYRSTGKVEEEKLRMKERYIKLYQKNREREMMLASTLVGPHKDDLSFAIGEKEARHFASEGQQKSCAAALRLSEWKLLRASSEVMPLMLIDDMSTSLDADRLRRLFEQINGLSQVFVSSTMAFPEELCDREHRVIQLY